MGNPDPPTQGDRAIVSVLQHHLALEALEPRLLLDGGGVGGQAVELFGVSAALFAENQGQWADPAVHYAFDGDGANVLFTDAGPVFQVFSREATDDNVAADTPTWPDLPDDPMAGEEDFITRATQFSVQFDGADTVSPTGLAQAETVFNYHLGDQSTWRDAVPTYETVAYLGLYDGIDLHTWGRRDSLKYEFHIAPGADYTQISVSYTGIEGLSIDAAGALHVQTDLGELVDDAPYIYQDIASQRVEVTGAFELIDSDTCTFTVTGDYDSNQELVIDPDLAWSTYMGGSAKDTGFGIAVDASGGVYVTGNTASSGWVSGGYDTSYNGVFVAKLTSAGDHVWSTYMGGSSSDKGLGIAVNASGGVYVTGHTDSPGWASGGFDTSHNGSSDIFVAKLTSAGGHGWSTYMGGSNTDRGYGIAVDASDGVYVTGWTSSSNWADGGFDTSHNGSSDIFIAKLTSAGDHVWSTYMGGGGGDAGYGIAVDASGGVYVTGSTASSGWVSGGFDTSHHGMSDIFVAKLTSAGGHAWSTYMGGSSIDEGNGIAVDASGGVHVTGYTGSSGWASGGFDTSHNGEYDIFVVRLTSTGGHAWSTYMGGSWRESGRGIAVDASGGVYVTGYTGPSDWVSGGFDTSYNGGERDIFVAKLTSTGGHAWSTYMGGSRDDRACGVALDASGEVYVTGSTASSDWVWAGFDTSYNGGGPDIFVAKIGISEPAMIPDVGLEQAIRDEIGVPSRPLTRRDLWRMSSLDGTDRGISDLTGLEDAVNLRSLRLSENNITYVSTIAHCVDLEYLDLSDNLVTDISALGDLLNLTSLHLNQNTITDISPMDHFMDLEYLDLSDNLVTDISPLGDLSKLDEVRLDRNYLHLRSGSPGARTVEKFDWYETTVHTAGQYEPGDVLEAAYFMGSFGVDVPHIAEQEIGDGLHGAADVDLFRITLAYSETLAIQVSAQANGSDLDAHVRVFSAWGGEIASNNDRDGLDPGLVVYLTKGTYYVGVSGHPNAAYDPTAVGGGASSQSTGQYVLQISNPPRLNWDGTEGAAWTSDHWNHGAPVTPIGDETMVVESGTVVVSYDVTTVPGAAASLEIAPETGDNATVEIGAEGRLAVTSNVTVGKGGVLSIDGVLTAEWVRVEGGLLTNSRGGAGDVTVVGDVVLIDGGTYVAEITGGGADTLITSGQVWIGGYDDSLRIVPVGGDKAFKAGEYTLIDAAGGIAGSFNDVAVLGPNDTAAGFGPYVSGDDNGLTYDRDAGALTLTLDMDLHPGDANLDGATDVIDRIYWGTFNFTHGTTFTSGDFNGDGRTDVSDRIVWNNNNFTFATAAPAALAAPAAPAGGDLDETMAAESLALRNAATVPARQDGRDRDGASEDADVVLVQSLSAGPAEFPGVAGSAAAASELGWLANTAPLAGADNAAAPDGAQLELALEVDLVLQRNFVDRLTG